MIGSRMVTQTSSLLGERYFEVEGISEGVPFEVVIFCKNAPYWIYPQIFFQYGKIVVKGKEYFISCIDEDTGEVLQCIFYRDTPKKVDRKETSLGFESCKDITDLKEHRGTRDIGFNNTEFLYLPQKDYEMWSKGKPKVRDMFERVMDLCEYHTYFNVVFVPRDILCKIFGCSLKNLGRELKKYEKYQMLHYNTKGCHDKRMIQIFLNPAIVWKGGYHTLREEWKVYWSSFDLIYEETPKRISPLSSYNLIEEGVDFECDLDNPWYSQSSINEVNVEYEDETGKIVISDFELLKVVRKYL